MCEILAQCKLVRSRNNLEEPFKKKESLEMLEAIGRQLKIERHHTDTQLSKLESNINKKFDTLSNWLKWGIPIFVGLLTTIINLIK